jgi:putative endonuclease
MSEKWSVYILECKDGSYYTGITNDVDRRVQEHKDGKASAYTNSFGVREIVYTEQVAGKGTALSREHEIKQLSREEKEMLVSDN